MFDDFWTQHFSNEIAAGKTCEAILERDFLFLKGDIAGTVDLSLCREMPRLKELVIHAPHLTGKDAIRDIPSLKRLVIAGPAFDVGDLEAIAANPTLATLHINRMELPSLAALQSAPKLRELILYTITGLDAAEIATLQSLTKLSVDNCDIGALDALGRMPKLRSLSFEKIVIDSLDFLATSKLTSFAADTLARDKSALACLLEKPKLAEFDYPLSDLRVLKNCSQLKSIRINGRSNPDLAPLETLPVSSIDVYFAESEAQAEAILARAKALLPGLQAMGYRQDWSEGA